MESKLTGSVGISFLHLGVVYADIFFEILSIGFKVSILKTAEHGVSLRICSFCLDSCLAVSCSTIG